MDQSEYQQFLETYKQYRSNNGAAFKVVGTLTLASFAFIYFSAITHGLLWFFFQILLGITIIQWFFLLHDLGHDHFFETKSLNVFFGFFSSLFCILPFYPWRYIHRTHHLWTGWKDRDPTMTIIIPREFPEWKKSVINFCWKYWIPIFTLSFSFANFWNVKKLKTLFPDKMGKNYFSIFLPAVFHLTLIGISGSLYFKTYALAFFVFLFLCDPLLLSQHASIPQNHSHGEKVTMIHFREQDQYTRSLVFPMWMNRYIFFGFNNHILHHLIPTMPGYELSKIRMANENDKHWLEWLREAKKTKGFELLLSKEKNIK